MDKKLFLIDGHALIFKMYYAFLRRPMINSKGIDTSILFGFTKYIFEIVEKQNPTHLAVSFDPPGGTFRNQMYPEYKATRDATPQLIIDALEPLTQICEAMNIPVFTIKGYEADDVIGTIAKMAEKEGFDVFMVTPDKDYGQLITDHIRQFKPGKSGGDDEIIDRTAICSALGIQEPLQVIELLTLCGDTADNVPGVKGVGKVGAGKLIGKYGTVENIYAHLDELTPKQREAFVDAREHIGLSHELVTIKTDVPVDVRLEQTVINMENSPAILSLFDHYEFGSLKRHLRVTDFPVQEEPVHEFEYKTVSTAEISQAAKVSGKCAVALASNGDTIFTKITKIAVAAPHKDKIYAAEGRLEEFMPILEDAEINKYGYNLKMQYCLLMHSGISLEGRLDDIELMHYLMNPETSHKPDILARKYLNVGFEDTDLTAQASLFDAVTEDTKTPSMTRQAAITIALGTVISKELQESGLQKLYTDIEEPLVRVLARMEMSGVKIDLGQLGKFSTELSGEMAAIQQRIREMADEPDLNIMSPKQIGTVLFEKLRIDPKVKIKKGSKSYPTDEETLTQLADKNPIVNEILEYRGVRKLLSTYIEPLPSYISPVTGRIHTTFNQSQTATGRLSSSKPNLQNIPIRSERGKEIRKAFIPEKEDGFILSADYSQIELRIMAHLCQDRHLTEAFRHNQDVHAMTAAKIYGIDISEVTQDQRRVAKTANFGIMYGISAFGLSQRLKISRQEAKQIIDDYFANFPSISSYIEKTIAETKKNGYVETIFGRRRYLPDINSKNGTVRALAERNAINAPIQGSSADIIKLAMIRIDAKMREKRMKSRMILQIHDELLFDTTPEEVTALSRLVTDEMEHVINLSIPLTVECNYGKNWLEAH